MKVVKKSFVTIVILINIIMCTNILNVYAEDKTNNSEEQGYEDYSKYTEEYKKYISASDEEKAKYTAIPRKYDIDIDEFLSEYESNSETNNRVGDRYKLASASMPSSYDLRNYIAISPEDQQSRNICWAYASIATVQTYLAKHKITNDYTILSKAHMDYLTAGSYRDLGGAGSFTDASRYFKSYGLVLNSECRYENSGVSPVSINGTSYSDYSSIVNKMKSLTPSFYMDGKIEFPSIGKNTSQTNNLRSKVKEHIMNNGGLYAYINWNDNCYYNNSFYNSSGSGYGHCITIVGWDDNYSRDNFGSKPQHNGAYLALNSWGSSWGNNGFFWISYDDVDVESQLCGCTSAKKRDNLKLQAITVISPKTGTYKSGETITINAAFSTDVYAARKTSLTSSNGPVLTIKFGSGSEKKLSLSSVSGKKITYRYTLTSSDSGKMIVTGMTGTVYDIIGLSLQLKISNPQVGGNTIVADNTTVVTPTSQTSLKLQAITIISPKTGTYKSGEVITINAAFSTDIYAAKKASLTASNGPVLTIKFGNGTEKKVTLSSVSGKKIIYKYTLTSSDSGKMTVTGITGTVYDSNNLNLQLKISNPQVGGNTITADNTTTVTPVVTPTNQSNLKLQAITVISPKTGTYKSGEVITINAAFSTDIYAAKKASLTASNGPVLTIKFGNGTEKKVTLSSVSGKKIIYKYTLTSSDSGKMTVTGITGTVYDSNNLNLQLKISNPQVGGNTITADNTTTVTPVVTVVTGDVNGDNKINLLDVLKIRRYIAMNKMTNKVNEWNLSDVEKKYADINNDGKINLKDILFLRRTIANTKK